MGALAWKVLGTGSAVLAASLAQKGLEATWRMATGTPPPTIPEDPDTDWGEAVAWAVASGVVIGVARLLATRRAANYYRRSTGALPKALVRRA
ncbi:DUF4235 domain-containing protein [Kineosporia sp. A_224]|uniref:DUF4235 domain-containing protein n=1 Tax=Kineosporia sp. A_224 TaxID=1962180 RepID=UPI000B4B2C89|nr:DUF4235 domain-containing protein [Kineosporia sp. A_224]